MRPSGLRDLHRAHLGARLTWLARIVWQCQDAGVPVFVKQDSGPRPGMQGRIPDELWALKQFPVTEMEVPF